MEEETTENQDGQSSDEEERMVDSDAMNLDTDQQQIHSNCDDNAMETRNNSLEDKLELNNQATREAQESKGRKESQGKKVQQSNQITKDNQKSSPVAHNMKKRDNASISKTVQVSPPKPSEVRDLMHKAPSQTQFHSKSKGVTSPVSILKNGLQGKDLVEAKECGACTGHQPKMKVEGSSKHVKGPDRIQNDPIDKGKSHQKKSVPLPKKEVNQTKPENVIAPCIVNTGSDPEEKVTAMAVDEC
ncbi:unnamed protein product [Linum trigynum]|uniref:Uncharacterized protein n=1 Tax=Linum trigynum TaxID=586398 RepID=A0AAV2DVW6_9ROSI